MFPNVVAALPWRLVAVGTAGAALFVGGCQFGERRITAQWEAEKVSMAQAVTQQAEHVAVVTAQQSTINQEISNEFQTATAAIAADRRPLLARVPQRVRVIAADRHSTVPGVPGIAARVDAAPADDVPAAGQPADTTVCETLAEDAAQTTLIVVEFQRWYEQQARVFNHPIESVTLRCCPVDLRL